MSRFGRSFWWSLALAAGLVSLFAGERIAGSGSWRGILTSAGAALALGSTAVRALRFARAQGEARAAERMLLALCGAAALALVLYFAQSDLLGSASLSQSSPRLAAALAALWPAALAAALLPMLLVELGYAAMARAPVVEIGRLREALYSGLGLAAALVLAFAVVYVAGGRDVKWDFSYFRTARPGTSTRNLVASLDEPIDVYLFFPPANEVADEVSGYFGDLSRESAMLKVHQLDQALDLAKAKELGVTINGTVVFARNGRRELLPVGVKLEQVRGQLQNLDRDAQKRLLLISRPKRVLYLANGHGERGTTAGPNEQARPGVNSLRETLRSQNYELRNLSAAEGLATDVPPDASAVLLVGPTSNLLPEEIASLVRYLERGGRILVALDPESKVSADELLARVGLKFTPVALVNDQVFIRRTHRITDRAWLFVSSFASHPSTATLARFGSQAPVAMLVAGPLEALKDRPQDVTVDFTVHAHPSTFEDLDGNFEHTPPLEVRKAWDLAAAATLKATAATRPDKEGRLIALGDSDCLSDGVMENPGNTVMALDAVRWLLGDESIAGEISSEEDAPIQHTRKQDVAWFYSTIFLVPAAVLGAGYFATRRRRASRKGGAGEGSR